MTEQITAKPDSLRVGDMVIVNKPAFTPGVKLGVAGVVVHTDDQIGVRLFGSSDVLTEVKLDRNAEPIAVWNVVEKAEGLALHMAGLQKKALEDANTERALRQIAVEARQQSLDDHTHYANDSLINLPKANAEIARLKAQLEAVREANALLQAAPKTDEVIEVRFINGDTTKAEYCTTLANYRNDGWVVAAEHFDITPSYKDSDPVYWHHARLERRVKKSVGNTEPKKAAFVPKFFSPDGDAKPAEPATPAPVEMPAPEPDKEQAAASLATPAPGFVRVFFCGDESGHKDKFRYLLGFSADGKLLPLVLFKHQYQLLETAGFGCTDINTSTPFTCAYDVVLSGAKLPYEGGWRISTIAPKPNLNQWKFMNLTQVEVERRFNLRAEDYRVKLTEVIIATKEIERAAGQSDQPPAYIVNPHRQPAQPQITIFGLPDSPALPDAASKYTSATQRKADMDAQIAEVVAPFLTATPTAPKESLADFMKRRATGQTAKAG